MTVTNFCVRNSTGKKISADPVGNNLAFTCFQCDHPVLLTTILNGQSRDADKSKSCRGVMCKAKYYMEVQQDKEEVIIHEVNPPADLIEKSMEFAEPAENDTSPEAELWRAIRVYRKRSIVLRKLYDDLLTFLCFLIPDKPSKKLKRTDPAEYKAQKTLRKKAKTELGSFAIKAKKFEAEESQFREQEHNQHKRFYQNEQRRLLVKHFPQLRNPDGRNELYEIFRDAGTMFGFSDEEVAETLDSRVLRLLYYAWKGKTAEDTDHDKLN